MQTLEINRVQTVENAVPIVRKRRWLKWLSLFLGIPLALVILAYAGLVVFALFLPSLDTAFVQRNDRTIVNKEGNYSATFIKTAAETNGAYELVQVELEPLGGNDWHYHSDFEESFTVLEGEVNIGQDGERQVLLKKGDSAKASKKEMHFFKNALKNKSVLLVKAAPAGGLEKTLRVAYGLINDGQLKETMTENPWHMALLLSYSQSYLPGMPSWFQEPLINAFAKIAQWKGEDRALYKYFK